MSRLASRCTNSVLRSAVSCQIEGFVNKMSRLSKRSRETLDFEETICGRPLASSSMRKTPSGSDPLKSDDSIADEQRLLETNHVLSKICDIETEILTSRSLSPVLC